MRADPSLQWLLGGTIALYVVAMYVLAYVSQRRIHNVEDFLVAGRQLPLSLAWMTLLATWFGAGTMLTAADEVRVQGLRAAALDPLGAGLCLLLAGWFVAGPMWRERLLTVPDLFRRRFGVAAETVSAVIMVPSYFGWIAAQFVALAGMLELYFGIDPRVGLVLVAVVGTGYTLMGGMWSVTLTDAVQITLVLAGLLVLGVVVLFELGSGDAVTGWSRLATETPAELRTVVPTDTAAEFWAWCGVLAVGALGNLPGQDLMQRVFAAKSERVARRACQVAAVVYLAFGTIPVGLGLASNLLFPADRTAAILPALAHAFLNPALAVVFTVALMSAVLSTIDSAILSPAGVLAQNVFSKFSTAPLLSLNRWAVLLVAGCSLALAYVGENAYSLLENAYALTLVGLLAPMLFGLYLQPRGQAAALASMMLGAGVWLAHVALGWETFLQPQVSNMGWHIPVVLAATSISVMAYLMVEPPWTMRRRREAEISPDGS
ncbi:MAG: sodium:solute symporter family protein [Planctomycetales bacterium]|nr:sodium:solute symporter family protein [Planctomycetales bacterium]